MPKALGVAWKIAVLVAVIGSGGWFLFRSLGAGAHAGEGQGQTRIEQARDGPFTVRVQENGTLEALTAVEVKSNVEGEVLELNVEEGDVVKADDVLLRIDPEQIDEEVRQAEANLVAAKAEHERAQRQTLVTKTRLDAELLQSYESVKASQAGLEAARQTTIQQVLQAETDISTSKDTLERDHIARNQAEITLQQYELAITQYRADLVTAQLAHENAERELTRSRELFEKQFISKKGLEEAEERASSAKTAFENTQKNVDTQTKSMQSQRATIDAQDRVIRSRDTTLQYLAANLQTLQASRDAVERQASSNLVVAKSRLGELEDTIDQQKQVAELAEKSASASVLRNESSLETARQRRAWTVVRSSIDGIVTDLVIEEGEIITSGRSSFSQSPPVMTIADLSQMIVRVPVNEVDMGELALGQRAEIMVSAYPNRKFRGRVFQIAPSGRVEDNVVRFEVEVEVLDSPSELMPGMTADVDVLVVERTGVLQVPIEAVQNTEAFGVTASIDPKEVGHLNTGDAVTLETRLGKTIAARVSSVGEQTRLTLTGDTRGWRSGPVEFSLVTAAGERLASLSGWVTQTKSFFVEVPKTGGLGGQMPPTPGQRPSAQHPGAGKPAGGDRPDAEKVPVEIGLKNDAFYEILSGISEGTPVLIRPAKTQGMPWAM